MLNLKEFCQRYGISPATLYRMRHEGRGPVVVEISQRRRGVRLADAEAWAEGLRHV